ncbi:MAG TPA: ABC transporter permease [Gemmatimonadetes bacterium]|nr:ABC transporter permease [Gemmatimonadota bacterium]
MQRYILVRLSQSFLVLFAVSIIIFGLARLSGNPLDLLVPEDAEPEDIVDMERKWGLDRPLHVQYFTFLSNALRGDFGKSLRYTDKDAMQMVMQRFPATLLLAGLALVISTSIAVPVGVLSALKKDTPADFTAKIFALLGQSAPSFWVGIMLMWIFAVELGWLPTSGTGEPGFDRVVHLLLPALSIGWYQVAALMRLVRSSMLEVLDSEFIKLARIKGVTETRVVWKHALRNAAIAPITLFGLLVAQLVTGTVVTETVFAYPGVGLLAVDAIRYRDFQVMQTIVVVFAVIFVGVNLMVDIIYAYVDPRIRYS